MPFPFAAVGLGLSAAGLGLNIFNQLNAPDFPVSEDDLNKIFDIRLNKGLSDIASGARRRLVGAGQEGSGTIESVIGDLQNRFREQLENQRESAMQDLRLAQFGADTQASERISNILGGATSLGANIFALSPQGQNLLNPFGNLQNSLGNNNSFNQVSPGQGNMEFNQFQLSGGSSGNIGNEPITIRGADPFRFREGIGFRGGVGG